ncbi:glucose dehydrogenase [Clohesyomyces aquaticus]|uniref:Glucose dehydrogenase n=1 Tax=Clohesyomyces aquaticus TaxID=1231657 RepID=A0A1Y1ZHV5_9PLEO|nr:glucose dehydrogenase [Clohesyomyces aquaticus]
MSTTSSDYDYIIVGGGTAGVVIASRLSQYLPTSRILLLEAGPDAVNDPAVTDPFPWMELFMKGYMIDYSTTPQSYLNDRQILNPAGRLLSGSSAVNVGVWMRASSTDYALIAQKAGDKRFEFKNLVKYFKRVETFWDKDADERYHGFDGPIKTTGGRKYPLGDTILRTAENLGHQLNKEANKGDPTGLIQTTQCYNATSESSCERQHSAKVFDLSKVDVRCGSPIARILFDDNKTATGVQLVSGEVLNAKKEVIVSCGAQKTPQVLMLSGIGPSDELSKNNITHVLDSPYVGKNLFDHNGLTQFFKIKHPERGLVYPFTEKTRKPEYGQGISWEWIVFNNIPKLDLAPILASDNELAVNEGLHPHLQEKRCHFMTIPWYFPIALTPMYNPTIGHDDGKHIAFTSLHLLPLSRGTVTLRSADPSDNPVIDPKYLSTATDRFIMHRAVRATLSFISTSPLAEQLDGETPPAPEGYSGPAWPALTAESSDKEVDDRIRAFTATIAHPMGTCALGTVLDDEFRVKGVKGLRVCDASVFPEPVGAMPSLTIYALAEMCADLVAGRA